MKKELWLVGSGDSHRFHAPIDGDVEAGDRVSVSTRDVFGFPMTWRRAVLSDPEEVPSRQLRAISFTGTLEVKLP